MKNVSKMIKCILERRLFFMNRLEESVFDYLGNTLYRKDLSGPLVIITKLL